MNVVERRVEESKNKTIPMLHCLHVGSWGTSEHKIIIELFIQKEANANDENQVFFRRRALKFSIFTAK